MGERERTVRCCKRGKRSARDRVGGALSRQRERPPPSLPHRHCAPPQHATPPPLAAATQRWGLKQRTAAHANAVPAGSHRVDGTPFRTARPIRVGKSARATETLRRAPPPQRSAREGEWPERSRTLDHARQGTTQSPGQTTGSALYRYILIKELLRFKAVIRATQLIRASALR